MYMYARRQQLLLYVKGAKYINSFLHVAQLELKVEVEQHLVNLLTGTYMTRELQYYT